MTFVQKLNQIRARIMAGAMSSEQLLDALNELERIHKDEAAAVGIGIADLTTDVMRAMNRQLEGALGGSTRF